MPFQSKNKRKQEQSSESSSLQYLKQPYQNEGEMQNEAQVDDSKIMDSYNNSRMNQELDSRRRDRDLYNDFSYGHRVFTNNRRKQKYVGLNHSAEGIFLYKPGVQLPNLDEFTNQPIKVIISGEYLTRDNPAIASQNLYGNDLYTASSDCVCIGIHSGLFSLSNFTKNSVKYAGIQMTIKVLRSKRNHHGCLKNGIMSKQINQYSGNILKPESHKYLQEMEPYERLQKYAANMHMPIGKSRRRAKPVQLSKIVPLPQAHLVFNMNDEPAYKYSLFNISDKGYEKNEFLVRKLDTQILYLETKKCSRYQIFKTTQNKFFQVYRISKLKDPKKFDNQYFQTHYAPLDEQQLEIVYQSLEWEDLIWKRNSLVIKDKYIEEIQSFKFVQKKDQQ